ncbi:MAG TPA: hypothetical protein VGS19_36200 [Streptosporangiaceae bacterium]|nr:hypothetical protein [Streptosporangiaceae bacterium]
MMKNKVWRIAILVAGVAGLLALFTGVAEAGRELNHCEPLQRV